MTIQVIPDGLFSDKIFCTYSDQLIFIILCILCIWNVVYRYVLLHKLVCCALLQVIAQVGEVFSQAEETSGNAAHECNSRDVQANRCNKIFIIQYHNSVMSLLTQSTE